MSLKALRCSTRPPSLGGNARACVLIAIKDRANCKTRLAESISPVARIQLVHSMLSVVVSAAAAARTVCHIVVASPERGDIPDNIPVLTDTGKDLNLAVAQAHAALHELGCRRVVILPADLPMITAADIDALVEAGAGGAFAIAPDSVGTGTNALCLPADRPFRFQFGANSRRLHVLEAGRRGLVAYVVSRPGLEFDLDCPADLCQLDTGLWLARRRP